MENQTTVQTNVQQVDVDIDSWLGAPGAESIVTPTAAEAKKPEAKPSIFSNKDVDLSFIDQPNEEEKDEPEGKEDKGEDNKDTEPPVSRETSTSVFDELDKEELEEETKPKGGRPKTEKSGLVEFLKKRIESKEMFAFDDYDETKQSLDDYLGGLGEKDIEELWQANVDNLKQEVAAKTPKEFFESLPEELQYAAKYVMDGGQIGRAHV